MLRSLRWEVSKNARHASFPRAQAYGVEKFRQDNSCSEHSNDVLLERNFSKTAMVHRPRIIVLAYRTYQLENVGRFAVQAIQRTRYVLASTRNEYAKTFGPPAFGDIAVKTVRLFRMFSSFSIERVCGRFAVQRSIESPWPEYYVKPVPHGSCTRPAIGNRVILRESCAIVQHNRRARRLFLLADSIAVSRRSGAQWLVSTGSFDFAFSQKITAPIASAIVVTTDTIVSFPHESCVWPHRGCFEII